MQGFGKGKICFVAADHAQEIISFKVPFKGPEIIPKNFFANSVIMHYRYKTYYILTHAKTEKSMSESVFFMGYFHIGHAISSLAEVILKSVEKRRKYCAPRGQSPRLNSNRLNQLKNLGKKTM